MVALSRYAATQPDCFSDGTGPRSDGLEVGPEGHQPQNSVPRLSLDFPIKIVLNLVRLMFVTSSRTVPALECFGALDGMGSEASRSRRS